MGFFETEKLPMNPAAAENGGSCNGFIHNGSTKHAVGVGSLKLGRCPYGLCNNEKNLSLVCNVILSVAVAIVIISIISITLLRRSAVLPPPLPSPSTPTECCPDGWIGYQRKCYYFSESEGNWTYSQNYCTSFNASLVMIDSEEEMSFLRRYKGPADHWIGLQRMDDQESWRWKWIDGTIFNNWFEIRGGGECAYINRKGVASSSRLSEEPWICSKPVHR